MRDLQIQTTSQFTTKMASYPDLVQEKMNFLRSLVHQTAEEVGISKLEETLRWGEPSFVTKKGSTLRMDWKAKSPTEYAMYFSCSTRLVETFKRVFGDDFNYEGKRALIFDLNAPLPTADLKRCIAATLRYHDVKKDIKLEL